MFNNHDLGSCKIDFHCIVKVLFLLCSIRREHEKALQESLPDDENLVQ